MALVSQPLKSCAGSLRGRCSSRTWNFWAISALAGRSGSSKCRSRISWTIFARLQNLGAYSWDEFRSKAVHISEHPLHDEFLEVIRDPIFGQQEVWHDFEWEGV